MSTLIFSISLSTCNQKDWIELFGATAWTNLKLHKSKISSKNAKDVEFVLVLDSEMDPNGQTELRNQMRKIIKYK